MPRPGGLEEFADTILIENETQGKSKKSLAPIIGK